MAETLISQLSHVEVTTDKPEDSLRFLTEILGFTEAEREGQSVYLRGWGEWFHSSVKLTEGPGASVAHIGWRTEGPAELEALAGRLTDLGVGEGWIDGDASHGPAFGFRAPGGHRHEILWEANLYSPPEELRSPSPDRPERYCPHGAGARKLDHVTLASPDPATDRSFFVEHLAFKYREGVFGPAPESKQFVALMSSLPQGHNLGLIIDHSGAPGGIKHLAFWLDTREDVLRAADVFTQAGVSIEQGPTKHSVGENLYFYVCEPGGLTIELYSEGYTFYPPDWVPYEWQINPGVGLELVPRNGTAGPRRLQEAVKNGDRSGHGVVQSPAAR